MDKIKAKVEQVLHKDKDSSTTSGDPTGPHHSHAGNKVDPRVDSDQVAGHGNTASAGGAPYGAGHSTTTGHHNTTGGTYGSDPTGPHDSHLANKVDPRVDSDKYGAAGNTASAGGYGTGHSTTGHSTTGHTTTGHATTGHSTTGNYGSDPTGPHDSRLANKLDPRVDSDQYGAAGNTAGAGGYGTGHSTTGHSTTGHSTTGAYGSDPTGPHDSRLANKADPRVDSDRYGAAGNTAGAGGYGTGHTTTGGGYGSDPTGPHSSHLGNKVDPRVDSNQHGTAGNTFGANPGPAPNTAGPHKSDMLNKADPRVDSDLDGSKTFGGNQTGGGY